MATAPRVAKKSNAIQSPSIRLMLAKLRKARQFRLMKEALSRRTQRD